MKNYEFVVSEEYDSQRIDRYLAELMPDCSRTFIQKLIKDSNVLLNDDAPKSSCKLVNGDRVSITVPDAVIPDICPENIPIDIVYEDDDLLIVNKPKGMVVHPAPGHYSGTLVNAIMYHCHDLSGINGMMRPGIVHRIDMNTTGLLIICKNDKCHNSIAEQLKEHSIERTYYAICSGGFSENEGTIDKNIGRNPSDRKKMAINPGGKHAVTHYKVLGTNKGFSFIKCNLETGRTHQIRVHMASIGHPLLGDDVYGGDTKSFKTLGQTLHAGTIGFIHPSTGKRIQIESELPGYFKDILKSLELIDLMC